MMIRHPGLIPESEQRASHHVTESGSIKADKQEGSLSWR